MAIQEEKEKKRERWVPTVALASEAIQCGLVCSWCEDGEKQKYGGWAHWRPRQLDSAIVHRMCVSVLVGSVVVWAAAAPMSLAAGEGKVGR